MALLANAAKILRKKHCQSYPNFWEKKKMRDNPNLFNETKHNINTKVKVETGYQN